jgi:tetratricopeptide (TPR) repeat protein
MRPFFVIPVISALLFSGCIQSIALHSTGAIVDYGLEAISEESDLQLAEQSIASDLELLEGLLKGDPGNEHFMLMAARGYASYALGFAEDESPERARMLYLRARNYGLQILSQREEFALAWDRDLKSFQQALSKFDRDDVPAVFWTANGWGNYIRLNLTDPASIADIPKVESLLKFVLEKDEAYFFGSAHLAMGIILGSRPRILGGDPEGARKHFERCLEISDGKFLMADVYYAMTYAVQTQDKALFLTLLQKVRDTSLDILPEQRLANAIAKKKAEKLLSRTSDLFQ